MSNLYFFFPSGELRNGPSTLQQPRLRTEISPEPFFPVLITSRGASCLSLPLGSGQWAVGSGPGWGQVDGKTGLGESKDTRAQQPLLSWLCGSKEMGRWSMLLM